MSELRTKVTLALATGAHFYGEHMQKQVEDNLISLIDKAVAEELKTKLTEAGADVEIA